MTLPASSNSWFAVFSMPCPAIWFGVAGPMWNCWREGDGTPGSDVMPSSRSVGNTGQNGSIHVARHAQHVQSFVLAASPAS